MGGGASKRKSKGAKKNFTIINEEARSIQPTRWKRVPDLVEGDTFFGYIELPRGGFLVETESCGPLQFGIPPETIKDSMLAGLSPPSNFFVLNEMFDRVLGLSKAEFEFPIYFNFFVRRRKVRLIIEEEVEVKIKAAFQETLLGPKWLIDDPSKIKQDYPPDTPEDALPQIWNEGLALDGARRTLSFASMIEFIYFDTTKGVLLAPDPETTGKSVQIRCRSQLVNLKMEKHLSVKEAKTEIARVPFKTDVFDPAAREENHGGTGHSDGTDKRRSSVSTLAHPAHAKPFATPIFGVTLLGTSHGFDKDGSTTGFVLWMNRCGIMVDPPPNSSAKLERMGIPPRSINVVILTHCHADHDAGTFQKILRQKKVMLVTTLTIRDSFVRKYSAITGFEEDFLKSLFSFEKVTIGKEKTIYHGTLKFFYSLHTIPCIGFSAHFPAVDGSMKSVVYSGDTRYDPEFVVQMHEDGLIGNRRMEVLRDFSWDHTIVLHEMGVPPIHTPPEQLLAAIAKEKRSAYGSLENRLFVLHTALGNAEKRGIVQGHELQTIDITLGLENDASFQSRQVTALMKNLVWFGSVFEHALEEALERFVAESLYTEKQYHHQGAQVVQAGDVVDRIRVVLAGEMAVEDDGDETGSRSSVGPRRFREKRYNVQDCVGLDGLYERLNNKPSVNADHTIKSRSQTLYVLEIPIQPLAEFYAKYDGAKDRVLRVLESVLERETDPTVMALDACEDLRLILEAQDCKYEFRQLLKKKTFPAKTTMQESECRPEQAFLITKGRVVVAVDDSLITQGAKTFRGINSNSLEPTEVGAGTFIGDINNLYKADDSKSAMVVESVTEVECFVISARDLITFVDTFPGVLFQLMDEFTVPRVDYEKYGGEGGHTKRSSMPCALPNGLQANQLQSPAP